MNIFVSNLGFHIGNDDLKDIFAEYGEVTSARIITDKLTNKSRGFGFVEMPNDIEGQTAIKELDGGKIEGRPMTVTVARPKEQSREKSNWR